MVRDLRRAPSDDPDLSGDFATEEIKTALKCVKPNKAAGVDKILPEFILHKGTEFNLHQGDKANECLRVFPSVCLSTSKIPKIWCRAKIIVLLKPNKSLDDPKGYRPVSLLCVPYEFMELLLHAHIDPVIDPKLPKEQAGFRHGKSAVGQVTLLTNDIEDTF